MFGYSAEGRVRVRLFDTPKLSHKIMEYNFGRARDMDAMLVSFGRQDRHVLGQSGTLHRQRAESTSQTPSARCAP